MQRQASPAEKGSDGKPYTGTRYGSRSVTFEEICAVFHMPIEKAVEHLGVNPAILKRVCRENGIPRWPYRKVIAGKTLDEIRADGRAQMEMLREQGVVQKYGDKYGDVRSQSASKGGYGASPSLQRPPVPPSTPLSPPPVPGFAPTPPGSAVRPQMPGQVSVRRNPLANNPYTPPTGNLEVGPSVPLPWWGTGPEEEHGGVENGEVSVEIVQTEEGGEENRQGAGGGSAEQGEVTVVEQEGEENGGEMEGGDAREESTQHKAVFRLPASESLPDESCKAVGQRDVTSTSPRRRESDFMQAVQVLKHRRQKVAKTGARGLSSPSAYGWGVLEVKDRLVLDFVFGNHRPETWT